MVRERPARQGREIPARPVTPPLVLNAGLIELISPEPFIPAPPANPIPPPSPALNLARLAAPPPAPRETLLKRTLRKAPDSARSSDQRAYCKLDWIALILSRAKSIVDQDRTKTAGTAVSIVDWIDNIQVKEGQRSYRFGEQMGLDQDFQFDLTSKRVGISTGIEQVLVWCNHLTKLVWSMNVVHSRAVTSRSTRVRPIEHSELKVSHRWRDSL